MPNNAAGERDFLLREMTNFFEKVAKLRAALKLISNVNFNICSVDSKPEASVTPVSLFRGGVLLKTEAGSPAPRLTLSGSKEDS